MPGDPGASAAAIIVHDSASNVAGAVELRTAGTTADILGGGFDSGEVVSLTTTAGGAAVVLGSGTANAGGAFTASVTIPASMTTGVYTINGVGDKGNVGYGVVVITDKVAN